MRVDREKACNGASIGIDTRRVKSGEIILRRCSNTSDFVTIRCSSPSKGLLSADNAMVLAVLVLGLPKDQQRQALRYGILGAFCFRALATLLAVYLIQLGWVKLARRGVSAVSDVLTTSSSAAARRCGGRRPRPRPMLGLSAVLGDRRQGRADRHRLRHRLDPRGRRDVAEDVGHPDRRHPGHHRDAARHRPAARDCRALSGARGRRLHHHRVGRVSSWWSSTCTPAGYVHFEIPKWLSLGLIVVIFGVSFLYARAQEGKHPDKTDDAAKALLADDSNQTESRPSLDSSLPVLSRLAGARGAAACRAP